MKKLYNVYHLYDNVVNDKIVCQYAFVGAIEASDEEITEFNKKWSKPRIYAWFNNKALYEHNVVCEEIKIKKPDELNVYNPRKKNWPDIPSCGEEDWCYEDGHWLIPTWNNVIPGFKVWSEDDDDEKPF